MNKYNPHHNLQDPQDLRSFQWSKPSILIQGRVLHLPLCRWLHGPPFIDSRQIHHQVDWMMAQQLDSQIPQRAVITTHEELLSEHAHAWQIFLSSAPVGGSLLLILKFLYLFIPPKLDTLPTLWP